MSAPRTLPELFYQSVDRGKPVHLRVKRDGAWRDVSSAAFRQAVEELALGLADLGVAAGDRIGIVSENRPEWAYADLAALALGAVDVPVYPSLMPAQVRYILADSECGVAFVSTPAQARKLAEIRAALPALRHVVLLDPGEAPGTIPLEDLRRRGREALAREPGSVRERAARVTPDDLATIIYTSGTTGDPKGVMLSHRNLVSNVEGGLEVFSDFSEEDVALSFLPLCHVFERMGGHYLMLRAGVTIAYAEAVDKVPQNMIEVRPTFMCSVPRLYEKMYARVHEKLAHDTPLARRVFGWALGVGREHFARRVAHAPAGPVLRLKRALAHLLVFRKIVARTGGRIRLFISGGAPLSREIAEFFGAVGLTILEGYGLTETSPVIAVSRPDDLKPGTVGPALPGVAIRIAPDGEILTQGPHVMKGYYRKPEATAEAIDAEGWFHTGDVGFLDERGFLTITDRKKDIIVTSGGKNIAPQPIENLIKADPLVAEIVMVGNRRNFPSALLVPNFDTLGEWAAEHGLAGSDREALLARPEVQSLYHARVEELTRDLAQFEKIKKLTLLATDFTQEGGELTPTLKVKRRVVEEKYKTIIDGMYAP